MQYLRYNTGQGDAENWLVEENIFDAANIGKCEAIFSQGNGYIGQRAALEEAYVGETRNLFVTGTFNCFSPDEVTELPNLPDMAAMRITLNGERFSMETGILHSYSRVLDLRSGLVRREVEWESPKGARYQLHFERFVSMANEHILGYNVEIAPLSGPVEIVLESGVNGRTTNSGSQHFLEGEKRLYEGKYLENCSTTIQSGVTCAQHASLRFSVDGTELKQAPLPIIDRRYLAVRCTVYVEKGSRFAAEKVACIHSCRDLAFEGRADAPELARQAGMALIQDAAAKGYSALRDESAAAWAGLWQDMDIEVQSTDGYHQLALRFALYHLNIMVKKDDNRVGIAAKGMTGEGYKGHSFWDTEIFILPYFSLTQPQVARTLLEYRWRCLYGARKKAEENGYTGAMYPWECAWIDDGEVTPLWGAADIVTGKPMKILTGILEHHITADIAFATWQYYSITGDDDFMRRYGYEIIIDSARFWASRCEWNAELSRYEINDVIGPDEYKEHVNNNAYTNYMAAYNMQLALEVMAALQAEQPDVYERLNSQLDFAKSSGAIRAVLDKLYLPQPDANGIIPQFDGYFGLRQIDLTPYRASSVVGTIYNDYNIEQISGIQVLKQADLLMLFFLRDDLFSGSVKRKNYEFYEQRTLHDSSLSKNSHCVLARDLGLVQQAEDFFLGSCNVDLGPVMSSSDMGIHSAAMGGIWQCAIYGFGGVRVVNGALHVAPRLHSAWTKLRFPLVWKGNLLRITVTTDSVVIENKGSSTVELLLDGQAMIIEPGTTQQAKAQKESA